jgi:hypothetical protein
MKEDIRYLEIPLELMKRDLKDQTDSIDTIKATVRSVLSAASLIISLVGALQLVTARVAPNWLWLYWIGVTLAAGLYVALIVLCSIALMPVQSWLPIEPEWDNLTTTFKGMGDEEILLKYLSSILSTRDKSSPTIQKLVCLQRATLILLPIIVILLLSLAYIPRI